MLTSLLLSFSFFSAAALADDAGADLPDGDVVSTLQVTAAPSVVEQTLLDLEAHAELWPEGCVTRWDFGGKTTGVGASALMTYSPGFGWNRRLAAVIANHNHQRISIDHPGRKGFVTTFDVHTDGRYTSVEMHTWIQPPPRPVQGYYLNRLQPKWQACQDGFLTNLAAKTAQSPANQAISSTR
ncbi:MAG: hypothetical protein AAFV53_10435 [Myxococcota bacterium]